MHAFPIVSNVDVNYECTSTSFFSKTGIPPYRMLEVSCTATKQKQAKSSNAKQSYPAAEVIEGEEAKKSLAADNDCGTQLRKFFFRNKVSTAGKLQRGTKRRVMKARRQDVPRRYRESSELHFCLMRQ